MDNHSNIYRCAISFKYSQYYISVILTANNWNDAKNKFISRCLTHYDIIMNKINFYQFYDPNEDTTIPISFDNKKKFEEWLVQNIDEDNIECLENNFEIIDRYEN
jgi:hypothetical protein